MINNKHLTLHMSNGIQIAEFYDIISPVRNRVYSGVSKFTFKLPYKVKDNKTGLYIKNSDINKIQYRYKVKYDNQWFVIGKVDKESSEKTNEILITCYSLAFQLRDKRIKEFKTGIVIGSTTIEIKNLTDTANLILNGTGWTVGTVSTDLDLKLRSIDIQSKTVLDSLSDLCEKWECIWQEDSLNKKINFINYTTDGAFLGIYLTKQNYLKNIKLEMQENSVITRLNIYGKNGISIEAVNPTGQKYIDDFSYFKNTIWMTQGLIDGLNLYESTIQANLNTLQGYLNQLTVLQASLETKINEYNDLDAELNAKQLELDTATTNGEDVAELKAQVAALQSQINAKEVEIDSINTQITSVNNQIDTLKNVTLNINSFLTSDQQIELQDFIIEDDMVDSSITEKGETIAVLQELLEAGKKKLLLNNQPRFSAELDVIAFNQLSDPDSKIDAANLRLGSNLMVSVKELNIDFEVKVIEIEEEFDDYKLKIKISNSKDIKNGIILARDLLRNLSNAANLVGLNLDNWNQGGSANNIINEYISGSIDLSVQAIKTSDNNFQLTERGLVMTDKTNPQYHMILNSNGLILSENAGESWNVAISKGKILGEVIGGKIIIGNSGKFNKIECFNASTNALDLEIGNYISSDGITHKRGIKIIGGALEIVGGIDSDHLSGDLSDRIDGAMQFGTDYNNMIFSTTDGITITRGDKKVRTLLSATEGFKIQKGNGSGTSWNNTLFFDTDGNASFAGVIDANDLKIGGTSILNMTTGKIKGGFIEGKGLTIRDDANNITFYVDSHGNLTLGGNINWYSKPSYTAAEVHARADNWFPTPEQIGALEPNDLANYITNTNLSTILGEDYVITGKIYANQITSGEFTAINTIKIGDITDAATKELIFHDSPDYSESKIYSDVSYGISRLRLSSASIALNAWDGGTFINGNFNAMDNAWFEGKWIKFNGDISTGERSNVVFGSSQLRTNVDFTYADITGLNVVAKFA